MSKWLKDPATGALYRIDGLTSVTPVPIKGDRADQNKVTAVQTRLTTSGGHTHDLSLAFSEAAALVDPPASDPPADPPKV